MINSIDLLKYQLNSSLTDSNKCACQCSNSSFDMAIISLLEAISTKNSEKDVSINININSEKLESILGLDTLTSVQNSNAVNITSKDKSVNANIESVVQKVSKKYGIDENLIKSIIKVESNFNPKAVSSVGAKGLMQIMPFNYDSLGITDPFDIEQNIEGGVKYIKKCLDMYSGNVQMALMAYNGGSGKMNSRGVKCVEDLYKMPKETQNYVSQVMEYYKG